MTTFPAVFAMSGTAHSLKSDARSSAGGRGVGRGAFCWKDDAVSATAKQTLTLSP